MHRGIYLLPSAITTLSLGSGFFAVINILAGHFDTAAMLVFASVVFDGLDGRVARITHTESRFGAEYDSLSDAVVFGCVPTFLAVEWLATTQAVATEVIYIASFLYLTTTLLRLARFNVRKDRKLFLGLPSPAAATFVASLILVFENGAHHNYFSAWSVVAALPVCGVCMVSSLGYYSFKQVDFSRRVRLLALTVGVAALALAMDDVARAILILSSAYIFSAPAIYAWRLLHRRGLLTRSKSDPPA